MTNVITGSFGSGKTTAIRRLMAPQARERTSDLTPPLSARCSVPRIEWMRGSAAALAAKTRSR
jgi:hypothetical protein